MASVSGCGEVWYRAWFGTKRPWVQVPPLGPEKDKVFKEFLVFFALYGAEPTVSCKLRNNVRDQVTEPSAAGGGRSEAEEEKNKENCEALQASKATVFFSVAVGLSRRLEGRAAQSNSPVDCCDRERPSDRSRANQVPPLGPY